METKVNETINEYFLKMALAPSEQDVVTLYETMMKQVDAAGLPKLEEVYNKNYEERMKLWE
ncbi:hypothetical protein D3C71_2118520 [compost metagenome]